MAGKKTYTPRGYSAYTDIPAQQGGYDTLETKTKTIERVRAPATRYTDFVGSPSKAELFKEHVYSSSAPVSPNKYEDYKPKYGLDLYQKSSPPLSPNKHPFSNLARGYSSEETSRANSGHSMLAGLNNVKNPFSNLACSYSSEETNRANSGPNMLAGSNNVKNGNYSLKTSTNNVNEESVYYSPRADPRRRGVLDDLSMRAQPLEPQRRYARPAFVAKPNEARLNFIKTGGANIGSYETIRGYRASLKP